MLSTSRSLGVRLEEYAAMRARRSTPSISAGVLAAAYAFRMGKMLLETCVAPGEAATLEDA